ncbi:MAG TPA: DUF1835 domain-containing protein [Chloroflexia bacterium]|nr:DUF1835 domain-containing protein [Chloroflexia bacterium]
MLHITNGESAGERIKQAGVPGDVLAWNDVLHEGPIPAGLTLDKMSDVRARFIADAGWGSYDKVRADFARRDDALARFGEHEEVVLWFEHDLYDQLQLIQILDWFSRRDLGKTTISLICIGSHPELPNFRGLGELNSSQLAQLFPTRHRVSAEELAVGGRAWRAYRASDPSALEKLLDGGTEALPFLRGALLRHFEQFPSTYNGLSRTERQVLEVVASGILSPVEIFLAAQAKEGNAFMGDTTLWTHVREMCRGSNPLLSLADGRPFRLPWECMDNRKFLAQEVVLTEHGRAVAEGKEDWVALNGIDRWLGGVHLQGAEAAWRWDIGEKKLVSMGAA